LRISSSVVDRFASYQDQNDQWPILQLHVIYSVHISLTQILINACLAISIDRSIDMARLSKIIHGIIETSEKKQGCIYTLCSEKKTPTHIFFHISMNYLLI